MRIQVAGREWHVPGGSALPHPVSQWVVENTYRDHMLGLFEGHLLRRSKARFKVHGLLKGLFKGL